MISIKLSRKQADDVMHILCKAHPGKMFKYTQQINGQWTIFNGDDENTNIRVSVTKEDFIAQVTDKKTEKSYGANMSFATIKQIMEAVA